METIQTRREFLKTSGKLLAGFTLATVASPLMSLSAEAEPGAVSYPFAYVKLDPKIALERGYKGFYAFGGCGMGTFDAIIGQLADDVGYPFDQVPVQMLASASAGFGTGSLCGSLGGAIMAAGLVCEQAEAKEVVKELFAWYREHPFPGYQPEISNPTTVANSIDCLDSLSAYMTAANVTMASDERKARCASVTGETAAKAVELINAIKNL